MIETLLTLAERGGVCAPPIPERLSPAPDDDFWYNPVGYGGQSASGVRVTEQTALRITAFYACIRVIAETIASLPLNVYRKQPSGGRIVDETHPLQYILHNSPNEELTAFEFWELVMVHLLMWGNAYARIILDTRNNVQALELLSPWQMTVYRDNDTNVRAYRYTQNGQHTVYLDEDLLHIPGLGYDGLTGLGPVSLFRETLGMTQACEEFASRFFANNSVMGGYISHPAALSDKAKKSLMDGWDRIKSGLTNAHRMGVLDEGMKIETVSVPLKDIALVELRQFGVEEIARIFRVPPHLIQHLLRSTNNNIEHQGIDFATHTIRPWAERIENRLEKALLGVREAAKYEIEFDLTQLLRGDSVARATYFSTMRNSGAITGNEWREAEGYNPHPDGEGLWIQGAMVPVDVARKMAENPPQPQQKQEEPA